MLTTKKRTGLRALACAAALLGLLAAASPALASTASLQNHADGDHIDYQAVDAYALGQQFSETNRVTIRPIDHFRVEACAIWDPCERPDPVWIDDPGANITAISCKVFCWGCDSITTTRAECPLTGNQIDVFLKGGDDTFDMQFPGAVGTWVNGGTGSDRLTGGDGADSLFGAEGDDRLTGRDGRDHLHGGDGQDRLDGGAGNDHLDGGAGNSDTADYSSRTEGVSVTLNTSLATDGSSLPADDGGDAEADNVLDSIERVRGGAGNDYLIGSDTDNVLVGNGGGDQLNGKGGNDYIVSAYDQTHDSVECGNGYDRVIADGFDFILPGCEQVETPAS